MTTDAMPSVRQQLLLAGVSPALIQAYRDEELTLDHLIAFAVREDQEAQERVFGQVQTLPVQGRLVCLSFGTPLFGMPPSDREPGAGTRARKARER